MPVAKSCEHCGASYRVPPSRAESARFCTIACSSAAKVHTPRRGSYYKPRPGGLECMICKGKYWALGVHVKHKHGISASDYKREFGLLASTPLVHEEISEAAKASIHRQLSNPDRREEMRQICIKNAGQKYASGGGWMGSAGKAKITESNRRRNDAYLLSVKDKVQKYIDEEWVSYKKARQDLKMSHATIKKMILLGLVKAPRAICGT